MTTATDRTALRSHSLWRIAAPGIALIAMLLGWELLVRGLALPTIVLPAPLQVAQAAWRDKSEILTAFLVTGTEIITAYAASILLGGLLAIVFSQARWLRLSLYPYAIFLKTLPIIAIAPLIAIWMGEGFWSVVVIAWIVAFLPILTNTTEGLISVPENLQELLRLYGASRWQRVWKLQLPNALPYLVAGAKISSVSAVLGAVVGEMFVGYSENPGIGFEIFAKRETDVAAMFVYIGLSGLIGIGLFGLTGWFGERVLLSWRDKTIDDT